MNLADTDWMENAACRGKGPELFFVDLQYNRAPGRFETMRIAAAKAVCRGCPVRAVCLEYALGTGQDHGVWGGYDEQERRIFRRAKRRSGSFEESRSRDTLP